MSDTNASPSITLQSVAGDSTDRVRSLLKANGLPHRDVETGSGRFFEAYADEERIGVGGVELYGSVGLLRSVVVTEPNRGEGYGSALCDALEEYARNEGVETLYLLTTTAASFFRGRGYEAVARETVPRSIKATTEFSELCPDSATCMRGDLR